LTKVATSSSRCCCARWECMRGTRRGHHHQTGGGSTRPSRDTGLAADGLARVGHLQRYWITSATAELTGHLLAAGRGKGKAESAGRSRPGQSIYRLTVAVNGRSRGTSDHPGCYHRLGDVLGGHPSFGVTFLKNRLWMTEWTDEWMMMLVTKQTNRVTTLMQYECTVQNYKQSENASLCQSIHPIAF